MIFSPLFFVLYLARFSSMSFAVLNKSSLGKMLNIWTYIYVF